MIRSSSLKAFLAVGLLPLAGCASIGDMADRQRIYGGTRFIADQVDQRCVLGPCSSCGPCWLFDLPLSFAADTVLLPVTATIAITREAAEEPGRKEKGAREGSP